MQQGQVKKVMEATKKGQMPIGTALADVFGKDSAYTYLLQSNRIRFHEIQCQELWTTVDSLNMPTIDHIHGLPFFDAHVLNMLKAYTTVLAKVMPLSETCWGHLLASHITRTAG